MQLGKDAYVVRSKFDIEDIDDTLSEIKEPTVVSPVKVKQQETKATAPAPTPLPTPAPTQVDPVRQKLNDIAKKIGAKVLEGGDIFSASIDGLVIPDEDKQVEGALSANHVFAHELGLFIMKKRGVSYSSFSKKQLVEIIPNFKDLELASKDFRPDVWAHKMDKIKRHARKNDEIIADAIASVLLGNSEVSLLQDLKNRTGLKNADFGLDIANVVPTLSPTPTPTPTPTLSEKAELLSKYGFIREWPTGRWMFSKENGVQARFKADSFKKAVDSAWPYFEKTPKDQLMTKDQRFDAIEKEFYEKMDEKYKSLSISEIQNRINELGKKSGDYQQGEIVDGKRSTKKAVSNEAVRSFAEEKMNLERYLDERKKLEPKENKENLAGQAPKLNPFEMQDIAAKLYGYSVREDGRILRGNGEATNVYIKVQKGRFVFMSDSGQKLFTGADNASVGDFLAQYWYAKKKDTTAPIPVPKAQEAFDDGYVAIPEQYEPLGIPRADMPQINSAHRGALINLFKGRGIGYDIVEVDLLS